MIVEVGGVPRKLLSTTPQCIGWRLYLTSSSRKLSELQLDYFAKEINKCEEALEESRVNKL